MQSGFAYSRARARSFYKQQTPDKTKSINDEEELRTDVLERSLVEQKKFENFWEGIRRGVHSYYTRKIVDTNIKLEHGNTKSNTRRKNNGDAYLFHPENIYKILWDFFIGFLVMYIVIITPLQIGFDEKDTPTTLGILYFVIACFAMDMVFTFNTAYYDSKSDIMIYDRTVIVQKYLRFWFWIDLISTIPIDLIVSSDSDSTTGNKLQSLRMIRFFRLFRLFRFFRVIKEAARMSSFGISPQIVNLVLLIIQIFFVAHIFACFWHFITLPQAIGSFPNNWVDTAGFTNQSVSARYVASLYYVIVTMLTVGYGDIHATNQLERFYAILTMMTGSVVFGALISKVTSLIDKTNPQAKAFAESMMEFKYFINETTLPKAMKDRAKDAYSYYMTKKSLIGESGIFDNLAKPLLNELYFDLYHDSIEKIKLFKCSDPSFVVTLLKAAKPFQALPDEVLYDEGDVCNEFIFVQKGSIRLTVSDGQKMVLIGCVLEGSYFGDAEYYKNICSIAQYSALERSDLLSVSHTAMNNALEENAMMNSIFTKYCKRRYTALTRVLRSKTKVDTRANPYVKSLSKHASSIFQRSDGVKFTSKAVLWIDGELDDHLTSMATIQSRDPVKHDSVRILRFVDGQKQFTEESPIVFEKAQLLNPHGQYKVMWDAFMAVLVFYSALIVPVEIAFSGDAFYGTGALGWAINAFFGVDIIVNFRTGYISAKDDNAIIVTPQKVAEKYLKSWFIIDLLSTIPFDAIIQSAVGYNSSSYGGLLKTFRVFRLFRLVRLFKVSNYIHEVEDFFGINPAAFNLLRLLVEVYVIIHWSSCIWWGLTSVMSDHPWFSYSGPDGFFWGTLIGDNVKLSAKYLVSTYFTLTSFTTVGYGDIYPVNTLERLLCVFMVLAGASVFGYLIANISGLLSNFSSSSASSTERIMLIREFLKERQTPKSLETKIINHFNKQFRDSSTYDVSMIVDRLPSMIGNEILYNIYNKIIDKISFFRYISMKSVQLYLFRLLKPVHHDSNHYLYKEGDYASEMIFIISGNVRIFRKEVKAEMSEVLKRAKQEQQEQLLLKSKKSTRFSVMVTDVDKEGKSDDLTRKNTATALADLVIENPTAPTSDTAASAHIEQRAERKRLIDLSIFDSIIEPEQLHEDVQQLPPRPRGGSISAPSSSKNSSSINVSSTLTAPNLLTTGSMGTRFFSKSLGNRFFSSQMGESFDDDSKHGKESDAGGATSTNNTRNLRSILRNMKQNTTMSYPNIRGGSSGSVNGDNAPTIASTTSTTGRPSSLNLNRRNLLASTKSRRQSIRRQGSASKKELEEATQNLYAALNQIKNNEKDVYSQLDCFDTPFSQLEAADFAMLHLELVGDLTTGDFLGHNAYMVNEGKHFTTARTTMPSTVYTLSQVEIARVVRIEPTVGIQLQHALTSAVIAQTKTVGKFLHSRRRGDFLKEIKMEHESKKKITSEINKNTTSGLKAISGRGRYSPLNLGDFDDSSSVHTGSIKRSIPIPPPPPPPISTPDTIDVRHANTGSSASMSRFHLGGFSSRFGLSARPAAPPSTQDSTTDALSHANIYQMNKERNFEYLFQKRNLYYDSDEEGHVDDDLTPMDQRQNSRSGRSKRTGPRGANKSNKSKKTEGKEDKGEERPKQKSPLIDFSRISPSRFLSRKKAKAEDNVTTAPAVPPTIHETLREHAGESKEKDPINTSNHSPPPNNNSNNGNNVVKLKRRDSIRDFLARSSGLHLNQTPNIKGADKYRGLKRARIVKRAFSVNDLTEKNVAHQRNLLQLLEGGKNNHSLSFTSTDATRSPEKASPRRSIAFPTSTAARTVSPRFRRNRSEDTDYGVIEEREETRKRRAEDHANQMNHQISLARRQSFPSYDYQEWKANKLNRFVL